MPKDADVLLNLIVMMYESNPEFVASLMSSVLAAGEAREGAKERLGFLRET